MRFSRTTLRSLGGPLKASVANAQTSWGARASLILELHDDAGRVGRGEASPLPGYSRDDLTAVTRALTDVHERVGSAALEAELAPLPSARFALETAMLDLEAQVRGVSIAAILGETSLPRVPRSGLVDRSDAVSSARALLARGIGTLKMKVGGCAFADDLARVSALRSALGPAFTLRLDANGAWSATDARAYLERLRPFDLELVEEPTAGHALLRLGTCAVPWAADESLQDAALAAALLVDPACAAVVLKPQLLGLYGARALALAAIQRGKRVIVTHCFDGPIAIAAACELALSLPTMPLACGLDPHPALAAWPSVAIPQLATPGFVVRRASEAA
jgi:o-succinylbenzoate synthase